MRTSVLLFLTHSGEADFLRQVFLKWYSLCLYCQIGFLFAEAPPLPSAVKGLEGQILDWFFEFSFLLSIRSVPPHHTNY